MRAHRYRAKFHGDCASFGAAHWHVTCRDKGCGFSWLEPTLFDPRRYDRVAV